MIKDVTRVFKELEIPAAVEIVIHEILRENWGIEGELASEKFKETRLL